MLVGIRLLMGDWRTPALPKKRFELMQRARMLTPEVVERGSSSSPRRKRRPVGQMIPPASTPKKIRLMNSTRSVFTLTRHSLTLITMASRSVSYRPFIARPHAF